MRWITLSIAVLAAALVAPGVAVAQELPPGSSGVDQYTENIPGPGGDKPSNGLDKPDGGNSDGGNLPPGVAEELAAQGADGTRAAILADVTAPERSKRGEKARGDGGAAGDGADGGGTIAGIVSALVGSDGGMGVFLPILLVVTLLVALAVAATRLRRRGQPAGR